MDDVILNKCASIERCVRRVREEYNKDIASFSHDFTRQDAAILNIQRACEAALDVGHHIIRIRKLGIPQSARDVFQILEDAAVINAEMANDLKRMVGFRNLAVHDYQRLQLPILLSVIEHHLDDFLLFSHHLLKQEAEEK